jgi:hypothetical protein
MPIPKYYHTQCTRVCGLKQEKFISQVMQAIRELLEKDVLVAHLRIPLECSKIVDAVAFL